MKKKLLCTMALLLVLLAVVCCLYATSKKLVLTPYRIEADIPASLRVVLLSDLHNAEFGEKNEELITVVSDQQPDLILFSGDMLNRDERDISVFISLISELKDIAPVYFGYGNHEVDWEIKWDEDLREKITAVEAVVVQNDFVDVNVSGVPVRIGGYMGYYRQPGMLTKDPAQTEQELVFMDEFENTDRFKILINHIPTQWVDWNYIDRYPVDLVLSGHYHGGLMRIPFLDRGIYAPYVGFFPKYTKGCFVGETATCVLSAGLGNEYTLLPRINNPPEIVVIDLIPEKD